MLENMENKLTSLPLFNGLSVTEKHELLQGGNMRSFKCGQHIFMQGEEITHFYIVCSGLVQLFRETPDGQELTADILTAGRTMGKKEVFDRHGKRHYLSAVATTDVSLLEFPAQWLKNAAIKYPAMALNIISAISEYAHLVEIEAEHKSSMSVTQQLACFLQRICIVHDLDPRGFELPYSKTLIASRLGMQLETLSRTLPKLKECGIEVKGSKVSISDAEAIEKYVCSHCSIEGGCETHNKFIDKFKPV